MKKYAVAILGATGLVGEALIEGLISRAFPVAKLYPLARNVSAGKMLKFGNRMLEVLAADGFDFSCCDIAFFSAGAEASAHYAPIAAKAGCIVIDNTSHFRQEPGIPLIIPEVNPESLVDYKRHNIIANPNCSTIQMLMALNPIYQAVGIKRINIATYQSVSGTGRAAIKQLAQETRELLSGQSLSGESVYPKQIAFNVIPQIDEISDNGYSLEELKLHYETRKIWADEEVAVNATAVRVPVFFGHAEAIHFETRDPTDLDNIRRLLKQAPGIVLADSDKYPCQIPEGNGHDLTHVGRLRADISHPRGFNIWVVSDNVRKGAASNSIQIAELLISNYLN